MAWFGPSYTDFFRNQHMWKYNTEDYALKLIGYCYLEPGLPRVQNSVILNNNLTYCLNSGFNGLFCYHFEREKFRSYRDNENLLHRFIKYSLRICFVFASSLCWNSPILVELTHSSLYHIMKKFILANYRGWYNSIQSLDILVWISLGTRREFKMGSYLKTRLIWTIVLADVWKSVISAKS